jgi:DNA-directed RNA polymerase subunit N (RpoN/RPB10)
MLPIKCLSCGKFMGDIQLEYEQLKNDILIDNKISEEIKNEEIKKLLTKLYIKRWCCRSQVLTYKSLIDIII